MKRKILSLFVYSLAAILFLTAVWLSRVNNHQDSGEIALTVLEKPVRVVRDDFGVPYVYAESLDDAIRAQGFLIGQDRLFQIEFVKYLSQGRLAELIGPPGVESDVLHRVVGLTRLGEAAEKQLDEQQRHYFEVYLEGLNAYIEDHTKEHQLGLQLLGIKAQPWTVRDVLILGYFTNWSSSANLDSELIAEAIIDSVGPELADQISQISINPDVGVPVYPLPAAGENRKLALNLSDFPWDRAPGAIELGSNIWAVSPDRTVSGGAILANSPHIDSRSLPGIWYPSALITPEVRVVGAWGPGSVGFAVARTEDIAYGVTNSYGDAVDLYIETLDPENPENYLEGKKSLPFEVIEEVIKVRQGRGKTFDEQSLIIRLTRRGPLISDHGMTLNQQHAISLRWTAYETVGEERGLIPLMLAKNTSELGEAVKGVTSPYNYVAVDAEGSIAHFTAGRIPVRARGDGSKPLRVTDSVDSWNGMIPAGQMPGSSNPERGWLGNANHRTLPADYPFHYSTHFAHAWRYRRMQQLLDQTDRTRAMDHWEYSLDVKNTMAEQVAPMIIKAMAEDPNLSWVATTLRTWDFHDDTDQISPLLFQSIFRHFAWRTYVDDLGGELTNRMLNNYYYWQDRLYLLLKDNESPIFDDKNTFKHETRDDLFRLAARDMYQEMQRRFGDTDTEWQWGDVHQVTFKSPIVPGKYPAMILGGGTFPKEGSGETLNRGKFSFDKPYETKFIDSMRFVADMSDPDKVMAVVSGGVSGRQFDPHLKDQLELWKTGEPNYWWFSDDAIEEHGVTELALVPE